MQIMAEEDPSAGVSSKHASQSMGDSDLEKNVYEGGFKSWEGALDLAQYLLDQMAGPDDANAAVPDQVVEVRKPFLC